MLLPEDFYNDSNVEIFTIMSGLYRLNKPIDLITVKEKLDDEKLLDQVGGIVYLSELTEIVPTTSNIFEYAQIVKNKSVLRRLLKAGNEILSF
jgi:replicative DNA helicase